MNLKESFGTWYEPLIDILKSKEFGELGKKVMYAYKNSEVFPRKENIFRAFELSDFNKTKVVILGQDPYHDLVKLNPITPRATGLAFANTSSLASISPSLNNIHKELESDLDILNLNFDTTLESWAKQGVLLLNTALTVERANPTSHSEYWQEFTKQVISTIAKVKPDVMFVLWGKHAQSYEEIINENNLAPSIIKSAHPSPFSANKGFFGSKPFTKINTYLEAINKNPIKWNS